MSRKLKIFFLTILIGNSSYAMEDDAEVKYNFIVFKGSQDIQTEENKKLIHEIHYEKEGCVCVLHPSYEQSIYLNSMFAPSHSLLPVSFYQDEKNKFLPVTFYKNNKYMDFPKIEFSNIDLFFMRNMESTNAYQHPLPSIGFYIGSESFKSSIHNFLSRKYFNKYLNNEDVKEIESMIINYDLSGSDEPLIINVKEN